MAIAAAVRMGGAVYVYGENGSQLIILPGGDGLQGYTSTTVCIKMNGQNYIYDEKGSLKAIVPTS